MDEKKEGKGVKEGRKERKKGMGGKEKKKERRNFFLNSDYFQYLLSCSKL